MAPASQPGVLARLLGWLAPRWTRRRAPAAPPEVRERDGEHWQLVAEPGRPSHWELRGVDPWYVNERPAPERPSFWRRR